MHKFIASVWEGILTGSNMYKPPLQGKYLEGKLRTQTVDFQLLFWVVNSVGMENKPSIFFLSCEKVQPVSERYITIKK